MNSSKKSIPSDEEFEQASRAMEQRARGLDQVRESVLAEFGDPGGVCEFHILNQEDVDFRAYIFFRYDRDIQAAHQSGLATQIADRVYKVLEREGRGRRDDIEVAFEFDSHENVQKNFEGSYWLRLR